MKSVRVAGVKGDIVMEWFDNLLEKLNFGRLADMFTENKDFIMRRGIRLVAYMCFILMLFYLYLAYYQLS